MEKVEVEESLLVATLKSNLLNEINKRMGTADQIILLAASTVLDPRFKKCYFTNPIHCARSVEFILNSIKRKQNNCSEPLNENIDESRITEIYNGKL